IPVPVNHRLTADEAAYVLDDSDAAVVFAGDAFLPVIDSIRSRVPGVRTFVTVGAERRPWAEPIDALIAAARPEPLDIPGDACGGSMVCTAGTPGRPKGARRRGMDPAGTLLRLQALDLADPSHVHLVAGPLYHSAPSGFALFAHLM